MVDYNAGASLTELVKACTDALATLRSLGRTADAEELLNDAAGSSYDAIAADTTRNNDWKVQQYAKRYTAIMSSLATKLTAAANIAATKYKDDAARVFGTKRLPGDPATLTVSMRDARERIAEENDSIRLQRLLDDAALGGDDIISHAIVQKAVTNRDDATVTRFQELYPDLVEATARLWNVATRGTTAVDIATVWRLGALKPPALQPLMDYEIAAAAAGQTNVGTWNVRT